MKRELNSPDAYTPRHTSIGNFYEWIQEIICLGNHQWTDQCEKTTKFTTELIHNQKSSCTAYNITSFDSILKILQQLQQRYPDYQRLIATTIETTNSLVIRNELNQRLQKEFAISFNMLFKKKWQYNGPTYCTPLTSSHKYIDLVFYHSYNIFIFIKSLYDMQTNTNERILYGFLACLLQDMYSNLEWVIPLEDILNKLQFAPKDTKTITDSSTPIMALLFTKWQVKLNLISQFQSEFFKCKELIPTTQWYSTPQDINYTAKVAQFNQIIAKLLLNGDELGMDIYQKPKRVHYEPSFTVQLLKQSKQFNSKSSFTSAPTIKLDNINGSSSHLNRSSKQLLQLVTRLDFDISSIEHNISFLHELNSNQQQFQQQHQLTNFPIIGFISIFVNHCEQQQIPVTNKLLQILSSCLFDIWYFTEHHHLLVSNAFDLWHVYPMEFIYCYSLIQTKNVYDHPIKQLQDSLVQYHHKRNPLAYPKPLEDLLCMLRQQYLLVGIWQQPEIFNLSALYYQSQFDTTSDGKRAKEMMENGPYHEIHAFYHQQQQIYQQFHPQLNCNSLSAMDYIPKQYFEFDQFIMFIFVQVIEEALEMTETMCSNLNTQHWKINKDVVVDKLKKFISCAILKEERFRMMDFRDVSLIIGCGLFGICKYLDIRIQLAQVIGAMEASQLYFNKESLYKIYDKTLQDHSVIYCDIITFFNTHFVPTFGNLIRHFSKTVAQTHLGRNARNDGISI